MGTNIFNGYEISNSYSYKNLAFFFVCGEDKSNGKKFCTLQEAMKEKKVLVRETGNVGELVVESFLEDTEIFIQSGDIVKGGKQDRAFRFDDVILPMAKRRVVTFCVERNRWSQRGNEEVGGFSHSENRVTSNLTGRIKSRSTQEQVWKAVKDTQDSLTGSLGRSVASKQSSSSLQLTLEEPVVQDAVKTYTKVLAPIIEKHSNAVGYVFVVNGKITSSDIYVSNSLFKKLWLKLLNVGIIDAIARTKDPCKDPSNGSATFLEKVLPSLLKANQAEVVPQETDLKTQLLTVEDVKAFLDTKGKNFAASETQISSNVKMHTMEFNDKTCFDTIDRRTSISIHSNYVSK